MHPACAQAICRLGDTGLGDVGLGDTVTARPKGIRLAAALLSTL